MESSEQVNRETAEEQEEKGGRFDRESGEESSAPESPGAGPGQSDSFDTAEEEMTGSSDPGVVATPEGTAEVDEELEDRGDV